ncbi:hypothetical protein [Inquilinus sp.]|uniref:hypothetical protein n=1 Tax=Inquilinus sp. TaxID=1932117 RepID=UPI0031DBE75C
MRGFLSRVDPFISAGFVANDRKLRRIGKVDVDSPQALVIAPCSADDPDRSSKMARIPVNARHLPHVIVGLEIGYLSLLELGRLTAFYTQDMVP